MERIIFHCDCNNFYASVELLDKPQLKNLAFAVAGSSKDRRGIILAKNQIAKEKGVLTAETIYQAQKKCKDLVLVKPNHSKYAEISKKINEIYQSYTDLVEPFGIDESWLDVTNSYHLFAKTPLELAYILKERIKEEIGVTVSIGVSFNKMFAKLGSDYKKPDAITVLEKDNYKDILYPLNVNDLMYVGKSAKRVLNNLDIKTIGDLALSDKKTLAKLLGKNGEMIHEYANGIDNSPVASYTEHHEVKSVGNGITFSRNLNGEEDIKTAINILADTVASRLRKQGIKCQSVQVLIKDPAFKSITRQKTLGKATDITKEISKIALEIVLENWNMLNDIRMLSVTATKLTSDDDAQISFFEEKEDEKQKAIENAMDKIRDKYGKKSIMVARTVKNDICK